MTQDEIIRMAREAGAYRNKSGAMVFIEDAMLERFAALVAAHEREKQADISALPIIIEVAVKEAVIAEREACAKVCEPVEGSAYEVCVYKTMQTLAAAIRARSNHG